MSEKVYVTWDEVTNFINQIKARFRSSNVTGVYGIPRGGLVLAVMLSHSMNIPLLSAPAEGCIIIDDICDSGESLLHYCKNTSSEEEWNRPYKIVTMFYKPNELDIVPDCYMSQKFDKWIVFPWEEA